MTLGLGPELLERERELEQLDRALADVLAGEGRVVVIQGSPGIGKSRLLDALCARANGSARVLRGRGGELERDVPFAVVRELFEPVVARTSDAERSRLLAGAAGLAGPLLGVGSSEPGATDSAFAVMHGLYWLTANLADDGPLVLAVDDAHWTDEATQRWLAYLVPRIAELPVLLVLAFRPREVDPASQLAQALAALPEAVLVEPRVLDLGGTAEVVRGALGEADQEFEAAVYRATGGNPLLIRTLAGALAAAGVEPRSAQADRVESVGIDRIGRIVLPRMHRLGADAVAFARAAALLGEGVDARVVAALAGMDYSGARAAADALVVAEILRRDGSLGFVHPLVRAAVVEELPPGARAGLHRRAAEHLYSVGAGAEDVARHLLACDPVGEDWALTSLRAAGRLAVERGAPEAAVIVLEHALREPFVGDARAGLLHELGSAGFHSRHPSALRWLESALACAEDASLWMTVVFDWVAFAIFTGTKRPPVPIAQAPELGPEQRLGLAVLNMIDYGYTDASSRSTGTRSAVPTEQLRGETYLERMWLAAEALDAVMRCDRAEHAIELADGLLAHERFLAETSDNWPSSWVFMALMWSGKLERTLPLWQGAVEDAVRHGSLVAHEWARMGLGLLHLAAGRLVDAETEIVAAMELDTGNFVIGRPWKLSVYVEVLREGGAHREAEEALEEHGWLRENPPRHAWGSRLLESRGRLHLAAGRPSEGLADFRACGENMAGFGRPHSAAYAWRAGAAVCLSALGERDEAMRLAAEQVADARSFGAAPWLGSSLLALGTVTGGAEGIALLREAVEVLASSEARLEHAHALCDLGVLLRHERQVMESREPLRQALDLAERCGARALAERATQELRLAGARPRRRAITGAESLTAAERRVAVLAAQGKSNPEVAQSLFVTRKTVEKHLGSAFLKLQITSRAELPAALSVDV